MRKNIFYFTVWGVVRSFRFKDCSLDQLIQHALVFPLLSHIASRSYRAWMYCFSSINSCVQVMQEWSLFIINHGGSYWAKNSSFSGTIYTKEGWTGNINWIMNIHTNHMRTLEHTRNTPGCIFPCFLCFGARKYILGTPVPFLAPLHAPHDINGAKTMLPSGRTHPHLHSVQVWSQLDWWFLRSCHSCILPPVFPDLTIWNWNMASALTSLGSMHATPILCQAPVNVPLPTYDWYVADQMWEFHLFQVPAWDLVQAVQNQGWGIPWLSALHPGKGGLCGYGPLGPARWRAQTQSREIPRLHQEHPRWQDLSISLCLWTGRCEEEVWWICWWTCRQDMPTDSPCTDRQW